MKIERISPDKIRIFLTFDDLTERGIKKEDMWREIPKVHELFSEMMDQAYTELGFDASGPLAVEVITMPAQGMVVIVTRGKMDLSSDEVDGLDDEEVYEMEVTLEQNDQIIFSFADFEYLLSAARRLEAIEVTAGVLYNYRDRYMLHFTPEQLELDERKLQIVVALLSEYGEAVAISEAVLQEYGKLVIAEQAVGVLCAHFHN